MTGLTSELQDIPRESEKSVTKDVHRVCLEDIDQKSVNIVKGTVSDAPFLITFESLHNLALHNALDL
jgi:hypothetical protein